MKNWQFRNLSICVHWLNKSNKTPDVHTFLQNQDEPAHNLQDFYWMVIWETAVDQDITVVLCRYHLTFELDTEPTSKTVPVPW